MARSVLFERTLDERRVEPALVAIVYPDEEYPQAALERIVEECRRLHIRTAGVLQHPARSIGDGHCDVALEELTIGTKTDIFEDRGREARGCRLDTSALVEVAAAVERSLDSNPDIVILNKFGKAETEGGGLLDLIGSALQRGCPVLVPVPARNLAAWRRFAGAMSIECPSERLDVLQWLRRTFGA